MSLTPLLLVLLAVWVFRSVARRSSSVAVTPDDVRLRNSPRSEFLIPLDRVDRFEMAGSAGAVLFGADGETVNVTAVRRCSPATVISLNDQIVAVRGDNHLVRRSASEKVPIGSPGLGASGEGRGAAALAHLGIVLVPIVVPLVVLRTVGKTNAAVRHHATEALNFQATLAILWVPLFGWFFGSHAFGVPGAAAATAAYLVFVVCSVLPSVLAARRALQGRDWHYISIAFAR